MKCGYINCKLGKDIEKGKEIKYKTRYYHSECLDEIHNKEEIRRLYFEHINPNEVIKTVNSVISNLINVKKINSVYLLFVMKYIIKNKLKLNYPMGLHYYINDKNIKHAWDLLQSKKQKNSMLEIDIETKSNEVSFDYKPQTNNWDRITRGE